MSYAREDECNHILEITLIPTVTIYAVSHVYFYYVNIYITATCKILYYAMRCDSHGSQQIVACYILQQHSLAPLLVTSTRNTNTQHSMYMLGHLRGSESLDQ